MMPSRPMLSSLTALLDGVFPPVCAGCGRRGHWVCARCAPMVSAIGGAACDRCGAMRAERCGCAELPDAVVDVRSAMPFDGWVRTAIHALKYEGERARARHLGDLLLSIAPAASDVDVIVPVPLHPRRHRDRGFNQAHLLAERVSSRLGHAEVITIGRRGSSLPQVGLGGDERRANVANAFFVPDGAGVAGRRVLLVDDVITTTSTMAACSLALADAGAVSIRCVSVARAV